MGGSEHEENTPNGASVLIPNGTAPMLKVERILVGRPLKAMAFMCNVANIFFMIIAGASNTWMVTKSYRTGLWQECMNNPAEREKADEPCNFTPTTKGYSVACEVLFVSALVISILATIVFIYGMFTKDSQKKFTTYNFTLFIQMFVAIEQIIALIIYPIAFMREVHDGKAKVKEPIWEIGWAYGLAWGSVIFLVGAMLLLFLDKGSEEVIYRERYFNAEV